MVGKDPQKWFNASDADRVTAKIINCYSLLPPQFIQKEHPTLPDHHLLFSCVSDLRGSFLINFHVVRAV